jgi:hypothetical protein
MMDVLLMVAREATTADADTAFRVQAPLLRWITATRSPSTLGRK